MDLVAEMLFQHLQNEHAETISPTLLRPPMRRRFSRNGGAGPRFNADRFLNRFVDYPRFVRKLRDQFDLFHLVDHSYAQLLHELPADRAIVTCHDLDTFQCLLNPTQDPRSFQFRKMMARTLTGFVKAARVTCDTNATRDELLAHKLVDPARAVVVYNGVHPSCSPAADPIADAEVNRLLGPRSAESIELLHVGSTIPRKRIDLLLRIFAAVRREHPEARLIRAGGEFTGAQQQLAIDLKVSEAIVVLPNLERDVLAAVYRRADIVLLPSEREGFGLPVVEALACGTPVIATDLAVLREVGGNAVRYCLLDAVECWVDSITNLLRGKHQQTETWRVNRRAGIAHAGKFCWTNYTNAMTSLYRDVLSI